MPSPAFSSISFGSSTYASGQVQIHPVLAAGVSTLAWNLTLPAPTFNPPDTVAQPATHPPLPELVIMCDYLPWHIVVKPVPSASWSPGAPHIVTVGDVLHTIHRMLRLAVSEREFTTLPPDSQARVTMAFDARIAQADPRLRATETSKGIKRVDFLMESRSFIGLSMVTNPAVLQGRGLGQVWMLNVAVA